MKLCDVSIFDKRRSSVRCLLYLCERAMFSYHPGVRTFLSVLLSRGALSHKNHVNLMLGHLGKYDQLTALSQC